MKVPTVWASIVSATWPPPLGESTIVWPGSRGADQERCARLARRTDVVGHAHGDEVHAAGGRGEVLGVEREARLGRRGDRRSVDRPLIRVRVERPRVGHGGEQRDQGRRTGRREGLDRDRRRDVGHGHRGGRRTGLAVIVRHRHDDRECARTPAPVGLFKYRYVAEKASTPGLSVSVVKADGCDRPMRSSRCAKRAGKDRRSCP